MKEPNFIIIGAQKGGTTFLYDQLRTHPQVFMPKEPNKELYYFSRLYSRGWDWYLSFFNEAREELAVGEATPEYTEGADTETIAARVAKHLPECKLIYIVRDPIERLESSYVQFLANGKKLPPFNQAVRQFPYLIETSKYWDRIGSFRRRFTDSQILCLFLEDVKSNPESVLEKCCEFLGVDPLFEKAENKISNPRSEQVVDRGFVPNWIRKGKFYEYARRLIPRQYIKLLKPLYRKPLQVKTEWEPETLRWVKEQLAPDAANFLDYCDRPHSLWGWIGETEEK